MLQKCTTKLYYLILYLWSKEVAEKLLLSFHSLFSTKNFSLLCFNNKDIQQYQNYVVYPAQK